MAHKDRMSFVGTRCFVARCLMVLSLATVSGAFAQNPVPVINQPLVPDAVTPGGSAFTLTVNGSGFVPGSVLNWNGSARTTTFVTKSELTARILSTDIMKPGTAAVTVVNPMPGGGRSNVGFLEIS